MARSAELAAGAVRLDATRRVGLSRSALHSLLPVLAGALGAAALLALYLGLVTWAQDFTHARQLLWDDRYFAGALSLGFGTQVALYTYVRLIIARAALAPATGVTAASTGTSTAAMVACCAHHVTDALPLLGLSAAAVFLNDYRVPIIGVGLATNALGVVILARIALRQRAAARACLAGATK